MKVFENKLIKTVILRYAMTIKKYLRICTIGYALFLTLLSISVLIYCVFVSPNPNKLIYFLICFVLTVHGQMIWMLSLVLNCVLEDQEILFYQQDNGKKEELKNHSETFLIMN
jgi:hypothetical protein